MPRPPIWRTNTTSLVGGDRTFILKMHASQEDIEWRTNTTGFVGGERPFILKMYTSQEDIEAEYWNIYCFIAENLPVPLGLSASGFVIVRW